MNPVMLEYTGTCFLGERGERGNSQQRRGFETLPINKRLGNRGNTNTFLNIRLDTSSNHWLLLFPRKTDGEHVPTLQGPETLSVPTVPPFPRFLFTGTFGHSCKSVEVAQ